MNIPNLFAHWPLKADTSDTRHVHFGIDDGYVSDWQDCDRPWDGFFLLRQGKKLFLYVNSKLSSKSNAPVSHTFDLANSRPLFIGYGTQGPFRGAISDVRLYNGALSDIQVKQYIKKVKKINFDKL